VTTGEWHKVVPPGSYFWSGHLCTLKPKTLRTYKNLKPKNFSLKPRYISALVYTRPVYYNKSTDRYKQQLQPAMYTSRHTATQPPFFFGGSHGILGAENKFGGDESSCLHYSVYCKMIAAKMVLVRFLGPKHKFVGQLLPCRAPCKGRCSSLWGLGRTPHQSYGTSLAIWDHTVLPGTRHKWTHPA